MNYDFLIISFVDNQATFFYLLVLLFIHKIAKPAVIWCQCLNGKFVMMASEEGEKVAAKCINRLDNKMQL